MALVLTAGVVQAQNVPNFGNRANLIQAKIAPCNVYSATPYSWTGDNQLLAQIFNDVQGSGNIPDGQTFASTYENFVIRVSGLSTDAVYSVQFLDGSDHVLHTFTYYKDDVHISPLRALFTTDDQINQIRKVRLIGLGSGGSLTLEEAYFISALPPLETLFRDKDGVDIGNAYIDPSYLIRSNRLWVDIHPDRTFDIVCNRGAQLGTLTFSLPYKTGIDMSEVTFTGTDFDRKANVMNRFVATNKIVDLEHDPDKPGYTGKSVGVRNLYNSRYSGPFYDAFHGQQALSGVGYPESAIKHVNDLYWQDYEFDTSNDEASERRVFCQDFCLTKNTIKARTTRKPLNPEDWTDRPEGFRNLDYPVRPYYRDEYNWSDVVRGYWDASLKSCYTDLSRFNKMRISGSPNTVFNIRYATSLNGNEVTQWEPELHVKTDARGEANIDLDIYPAFYMQLIYFDGLYNVRQQIGNSDDDGTPQMSEIRKTHYVNNVELFEGEGRLVDLVGSSDPGNTANMYHVWNNDNNYHWQYATIVRWATTQVDGNEKFYQNYNTPVSNNELVWGTVGMYAENYADLTGYKAIRVYAESGTFRFIFNTIENSASACPRQVEIATVDSEKGYAEFDISNYEYFHLNGIKVDFNSSATVTAIKLVEDEEADYIFYGNGSYGEGKYGEGFAKIDPTVEAATKDPSAKVIDTRARCNNMQVPYNDALFGWVEQIHLPQTANPNVLFIERTNQFDSRKYAEHYNDDNEPVDDRKDFNLIVPSNDKDVHEFTSNNIELTDGFSFYAPKQINAAQAKYTRTFKNTSAAVNSIILPFAVSAGNDETYGFYETNVTLKSTTNEGKVGILKDEDVNEGDWLLQFTKKTGTTKPNTPYLYAVASGGEVDFIGVKESGTVIIPETPDVQVPAHKNMTNNLPNADNPTYDFYLRGVYEGTYMEHILFYGADGTFYRTPFMTVTPFRTIIKSPIDVTDQTWKDDQTNYFTPASGVKVVLAFDPHDDSSDINEVVADGLFAEDAPIYNVAGQRVNTFGKGIYIVGGKKILVK